MRDWKKTYATLLLLMAAAFLAFLYVMMLMGVRLAFGEGTDHIFHGLALLAGVAWMAWPPKLEDE